MLLQGLGGGIASGLEGGDLLAVGSAGGFERGGSRVCIDGQGAIGQEELFFIPQGEGFVQVSGLGGAGG
ncbi:MAG: hypothetical protein IPK32_04055 [Verrucomicrobiaceae bacterium]|nr:hypothetical protein [Verrucomicrobiaceae bacterium]